MMNKAVTMTENSIGKSRILIVDDRSEELHAMTSILGDTYAVVTALRGEDALKLAARKPQPDLILLDIKMPGIDGYEVLRRLKADWFTANIPVIIVTGMSESEDDTRGLMMGAADYITKPVNPDWLKLRVQTQLELRRFRGKFIPAAANADGVAQKQSLILVVDGVPESIHPLTSVLSDEYRIIVTDNGKKAVEMVLGPCPPDLVLLDIQMPDMDGYEVCRRIKATEIGNQIPVIFLSVIDAPMEKVRGFSIGAADFISKPFDIDEVRARIRTHLELNQLQRFFEQAVALRTAALHKNEHQLHEAMNIARMGYWEYEFATDEFLFNDQYYALHKIKVEEVGGYRMSSADFIRRYVHPDDRPLLDHNAQLAFISADPDYFAIVETRLMTGAEEIIWVEARFRIEKNAQGRSIRMTGINQDITERKQAADQLLESKNLLQLVIEHVPAHVFWKDCDLRYLGCNTQFAKYAGYSRPDGLIGKTDFEMSWKDQAELYRADDKAILESGASRLDYVEPQKTPDGNTIWLRTSKVALRDKESQVIGVLGLFQDITKEKKVENKLIESKRRFSDMLDNVELISVMLDREGRITYCNDYLLRLSGWRREEIIGEMWFERFLPTEIQDLQDVFFAALLTNQPEARHHENEILTRLGERRLIRWNNSLLRSGTGDVIGSASIGEDITERRVAEEELKFKNSMLQTQQDNSPDAILFVGEDDEIVSYNQQFVELWQVPQQLVRAHLDSPLLQFVVEQIEDPKTFSDRVEYLYAHRDEKSSEEIRLKDGRILDRYSAPVIGADDQYYGRVWYFRDITERKQSEASLRKLSLAVEQSPSSIVITDLDTSIEYVNEAFYKTTGYSPAEIIGQKPHILHSGKTPKATYTDMWAHLVNDQVWKGEFINKRKDGSEYTESALLSPIRQADGKVTHYLAIKEDITEFKQAREALYKLNEELEDQVLIRTAELELARSEADHANHAKSDFLAAMSHEIRTPMNGVIGMLDVLQQSGLNETQMGMTNVIHDSAYALLHVINDILDFSKIEAGKITLDNAPMDFTETVEGVADMLASKAFKKDVSLLLFIDPALPRLVIGDAGRLRQILINLTGNAIKFSTGQQRPGKVSLRVRLLDLSGQKVSLEFSITDNGIGMDKATQARLFMPFIQANESIAAKFGGTGLGLVITQQLVHLKGGGIAMSSELGKGTEVLVRLAFDLPQQATDAVSMPPPLAGLDCLVVGAKCGIADDMAAYLADAGVRLERADDVNAARQWLNNCAVGEYVVVFDHAVAELPLADLRAVAGSRSGLKVSFVINLGYDPTGQESDHPRPAESGDLVILDTSILHRDELARAVGIAAGRIRPEDEAQQATQSSEQAIGPPTREEAIQQGCLILVAEDNEINQIVITHQLRLLNRIADVASNGREALEMWQSGEYGILLADLNMPEMNGYELCNAIRAAEDGKSHIPIIAFTANAMKGEADKCLEMGMDDYLSKPVQMDLLEAALIKWLPDAGAEK